MDVDSPTSGSSRDPTPSSSSSQPTLPNTAESVTTATSSQGQNDDGKVEKFLKKMEMEKKVRMLQQRLELASLNVKHSHGVKDQAFEQFEQHQPSSPTIRKRKSQLSLQPKASSSTSPTTLRSPTSLSFRSPRPRSLYDSLVEPLPPPSSTSPTAIASPRKRTRTAGDSPSHTRRASASMAFLQADPYASPRQLERTRSENLNETSTKVKRRSQSHSTHQGRRFGLNGEPELDAAKALTSMLGSGSAIANDTNSDDTDDDNVRDRKRYSASSMLPSKPYTLPKPRSQSFAFQASPLAPSPSFNLSPVPHLRTPSSHDRHQVPTSSTETSADEDEDKKAAELMIFLAHSPSPMKRTPVSQAMAQTRIQGARVLFADGGNGNEQPGPGRSALANSVTLSSEQSFGTWLGPERSG